jgi:hypothetical protein
LRLKFLFYALVAAYSALEKRKAQEAAAKTLLEHLQTGDQKWRCDGFY